MLALASLLAVALVDPVTRPLSPTADNDAIYAEIAASNPALTDSPAPAEQRLARREQQLTHRATPACCPWRGELWDRLSAFRAVDTDEGTSRGAVNFELTAGAARTRLVG